jgi:peroxiredoxin
MNRQRPPDETIASERIARMAAAGRRAPAFVLPDANGKPVSSAELLRKGPLVVTFYRGLWCPCCQRDLQAAEGIVGHLRSLGGSVVAICPKIEEIGSLAFRDENNLSFPILVDTDGDVSVAFGIHWTPDDLETIGDEFGADLVRLVDGMNWILPMQARYGVGQDGVIAYADVAFDDAAVSQPAKVLPVLKRLSGARTI